MMRVIIPIHQTQGKVICVGRREIMIIGICAICGLYSILSPTNLVMKVGIVTALVGLGGLIAFGRDCSHGQTIEVILSKLLRLWISGRVTPVHKDWKSSLTDEYQQWGDSRTKSVDFGEVLKNGLEDQFVWATPIPITWKSIFSVPIAALLLMVLTWIWTGSF